MSDPTEDIRRTMIATGQPAAHLAASAPEERLDSAAMQAQYEVLGFAAPFVVVKRRVDGVTGTLEFTHSPRVYFGWTPDA